MNTTMAARSPPYGVGMISVDATIQLLHATLNIPNDLLAEEKIFFGLIRDRLGTCKRPQELLRWFRRVTFAHFHRARDDGVDILLPDERNAVRYGVPAGGVRVGLTAEEATTLTIAVDNAAQPWNNLYVPYALVDAIANDMSFEDMFRTYFLIHADTRRSAHSDKNFRTRMILTAQQRYGLIDVSDSEDNATLLQVLISLEKALKRHAYPTALPYTVNNVMLLLPLVFDDAVCKEVLDRVGNQTGIQLVKKAIRKTQDQLPYLNVTQPMFSKAVKISDTCVKVRMGVYTASGWTEIATLNIRNFSGGIANHPTLDVRKAYKNDIRFLEIAIAKAYDAGTHTSSPKKQEFYEDLGKQLFQLLAGLDNDFDPNKADVLEQIKTELTSVEDPADTDPDIEYGDTFWRMNGVLAKTLERTKQWAAQKFPDQLSWLHDMEASKGVVVKRLPVQGGLTDITQKHTVLTPVFGADSQ
jgi:hypothetical protein